MTFDLILSSLLYHGREWFVFQDILTHLPEDKAAAATQRSKCTLKYTYRFGITRDWATGDGKSILVDRHFIDSRNQGRSMIFTSVLIDADRVQELFLESFNKRFRLKVQQIHLTATSLTSSWFEWHFDPKQKDGLLVKKTKLTVEQVSQKAPENNSPRKVQNSDSENTTPNLTSSENRQATQDSGKRRRPVSDENEDQPSSQYASSISESVLMRPRKKAKEANLSISQYLDHKDEDEKPEHKEPMSPDYKPDPFNIKRSLSPMEKPKIKLSPGSSNEDVVTNDVMLSSVTVNKTDNNTDHTLSFTDATKEGITYNEDNVVPQEGMDITIPLPDIPNDGGDNGSGGTGGVFENTPHNDNTSDNNSPLDSNNSLGLLEDNNGADDSNVPDSNVPDDANIAPRSGSPPSPASSLLDNASNIMENIKLQSEELCNEEEETAVSAVVDEQSSKPPSTPAHKPDCGAEACLNTSGASSTVCLCAKEQQIKQKPPAEKDKSTGMCTLSNELAIGIMIK